MHILVLPSWFENKKNPTLGSFFKDQAIALSNSGHKLGIIFPHAISFKKPLQWQTKENFEELGITVFTKSYFTLPKFRQFNINMRVKQFEKLFNSYVKRHGMPNILHSHSCALGPFGSAGIAAHFISEKYNIPYIISEHASAYHTQYYKQADIKKIKQAFENANSITVVSESLKLDIKNFGIHRPIEVIGNVIDTKIFKVSKTKELKANKLFTFVVAAYLRPIKNIDLIIRAFANTYKLNNLIKLDIIGNGEQKSDLIKLVAKLGMTKHIHFLGELSRIDVYKQLSESDCYILASSYETFSVAVHEALSVGLSVISTPCGGPEDIIKRLNEKLLSGFSENELSQAMFVESNSLYDIKAAEFKSNFIKKEYSHNSVAKKLETVLEAAIGNFSLKRN